MLKFHSDDVYVHGGAVTMLDIPSGGNIMVKEF